MSETMDHACPHRPRPHRHACEWPRGDAGFTIVEVLVAMLIFSAAVLGALALINAANLTALTDQARAGGVNLARQIQEGSRSVGSSVPYGQLLNGCPQPSSLSNPCTTSSAIVTALQGQPGLAPDASSPPGQWEITRDGMKYRVKVAVCTMDDPADGLGSHSIGGFCTDNMAAGSTDSDADDYKRVAIQLDWGQTTGTDTVRSVALINSSGVNGPGVSCLARTGSACPDAPNITSSATTSISFTATMRGTPVSVDWTVDGAYQGTVTPSGSTATFTWNLGAVGAAGAVADGSYQIGATAIDSNGNAGDPGTVQVKINRRPPPAPSARAGRNTALSGNGTIGGVDLDWLPLDDGDILYYRIYSRTGTGGPPVLEYQTADDSETSWTDLTIAALPSYSWPGDCDPFPTNPTPVFYWVVGVDQNGSSVREGTPTEAFDVNGCNHKPKNIGGFSKTANSDGTVTFDWDSPGSPRDPDKNDDILGYRIYRWNESDHTSSVSPGDRYEFLIPPNATSCVAGSGTKPWPCWTDTVPRPGGITLAYCVRAVDYHMQESDNCSGKQTF